MALVRTARTQPRPALQAAFAWSHPESGQRLAVYGEEQRREGPSLRQVLSELEGPATWFGAASFDGALGPDWAGFAPLRFVSPQSIGPGLPSRPRAAPPAARIVPRAGDRERWNGLVSRALAAISAGALQKVVLARAIDVEADADFEPEALLLALEAKHPSCRSFLVRGEDGSVFIGASPELLCRVEGDRIETEALAGSAHPREARSLLRSRKDLREHRSVVEHIAEKLRGIASHVEHPPEPGLRVLANVAHLHTPIRARLLPGRNVSDVAAALHPTPAVGGVPAGTALRFIADHEGLDRGLYAGVVGWVAPGRAELAVALRSALVSGRRARLFVGAGIVEGSSPEREFQETELKARALLEALGVRQ